MHYIKNKKYIMYNLWNKDQCDRSSDIETSSVADTP